MSRIFAIGDLHISKSTDKPMDVFGRIWENHVARICESWSKIVADHDIVLVPGDLSWAMHLNDAVEDLSEIRKLPGKKVFVRGNHDYWWSSISKVRAAFSDDSNMFFIQNDSVEINGISFAGSRGWLCPASSGFTSSDNRIYQRELIRLELSLGSAAPNMPIIALLHFPPFPEPCAQSGFTNLFEKYGVRCVVYGHLHGKNSFKNALNGSYNSVEYRLCSADYADFTPVLLDISF